MKVSACCLLGLALAFPCPASAGVADGGWTVARTEAPGDGSVLLAQKKADGGEAVLALACFRPEGGTPRLDVFVFFGGKTPADAVVETRCGDAWAERGPWTPMDVMGSLLLCPCSEELAAGMGTADRLDVSAKEADGTPVRATFSFGGSCSVPAQVLNDCRQPDPQRLP